MAEKTDLNVTPYYEDYNEDKAFQKVLFRAGRALQSRELIQSQSILQNQVERFGDHFFKEGSIVQGALADLDMDTYYVKVSSANPNAGGDDNVSDYLTASHTKFYRGKTTGVVAQVFSSSAETTEDSACLFVKYLQQGTDTNNSFAFSSAEELQEVTLGSTGIVAIVDSNLNEYQVGTVSATNIITGRASIAKITEGILFIRGFFVKVAAQELILEKFSGAPSYRVGIKIVESLITSAGDSSLLDNATGSTNENSPGADRLKFTLTLSKFSLGSTTDTDFVELIRVNKGIIELQVNRPMYNEIENTLARRTFDANGDFVVSQFTSSLREHLDDTTNRGFYSKLNGGLESKFVMQVSAGKAYVKGFEIDKTGATPLPMYKARSTVALADSVTPIRLGNRLKVFNADSMPEFGNETTATQPFKEVEIYAEVKGSQSVQIGLCRVRDIDIVSGVDAASPRNGKGIYNDSSIWNLYMFDMKMFTNLTGSAVTVNNFVAGDKVTGSVSGATGIVAKNVSAGAASIMVHDVVGTFVSTDAISAVGSGNTASIASLAATGIRSYNIDRARSLKQVPLVTSQRAVFKADIVIDLDNTLTGSVTLADSTAVTGFGTKFLTELKEGDIIKAGTLGEEIIASVTDDTNATLVTAASVFTGNVVRRRVRMFDQDQTAAISSFPRDWVATSTPKSITVKRQQIVTITGNKIALSISEGAFGAKSTDNYTISVIQQNGSSPVLLNGDLLNVDDFTGTPSGQSFELSGFAAADETTVLKVTSTVTITSTIANRDKNIKKARVLKVGSSRTEAPTNFYGTAYDDKEISLGVADVFKVHAVYEGVGGTTPTPPNAVINVSSGTFVPFEKVIGQTSNAHGIIINFGGDDNTSYFYYISGKFVATESIVGQTSNAQGTLTSVSEGSANITSRYFFDDGQRDGFYDLAKLTRKVGAPAPSNDILICFDYFTSSGAGDFFDVNSYSSIDYKDIPTYSPNRIDLGGLEPDGTFELSDSVDYRPIVGQVLGTVTFNSDTPNPASPVDLSNSTSGAVYAPFGYVSGRDFSATRSGVTATGASATDTPQNTTSFTSDITFYVGRIDKVFLHKSGRIQTSTGIPALSPTRPKAVDEAIELFEIQLPPYTNNIKQIRVRSQDHRRFTMKDIARINNRVGNLERITALSLLERDTQTKQILDANGLDRFKSGFLVDNFRGHRVGDVNHPDYQSSIDAKLGAMRPKVYSQFFDIELNTTTSSDYQKTGDLITLPYTEGVFASVPVASRSINVNPYNVFSFDGNIKLTPETDVWQDTEQLPEVRINREGNYDAIMAENVNALGTVWNSWQTTWVGEPTVVSSEVQATSNGSWSGDPAQGGEWVAGLQITRDITETVETQTRTGVSTSVVEDFTETRNDRVVSISLIPFIRARDITIEATNLKPNTNHYFFFDSMAVNEFVKPSDATFSQDGGVTVASHCKSDGNGQLNAVFSLPNTQKQRFPCGAKELQITSSFYNLGTPASIATTVYQAQGMLQASQTEITSTRNGRVITSRTSGERQVIKKGQQMNGGAFNGDAPAIPEVPVDTTPPLVILVPPFPSPTAPPPEPPPLTIPDPVPPQIPVEDEFIDLWTTPRQGPAMLGDDRKWRDPLAQSFLVDANGGLMLTSIDVFFATKDTTMPVTIEIRNMVNGYPGQIVMPFSVVVKNPADVSTSTDGSVATTFTFDSPVFLEEGKEMCFVVSTNSNEYTTYISRMGEKDLITSQTIAGQPYAGSLFMSQNASTWTAEQTDDLKFNIKFAQFSINKTPVLKFDNKALPVHTLQSNPIETFSGQTYVRVLNYSHGMYSTNSNVTIGNVSGDKTGAVLNIGTPVVSGTPTAGTYNNLATTNNGSGSGVTVDIVVNASNVITYCKISATGSGYTALNTLTIAAFGGATATVAIDTIGETLGGIPVGAINATFIAIANIGIDSHTVIPSLSAYDLKTGYTADDSTLGGGLKITSNDALGNEVVTGGCTSTRDYYFDTIHTMIPSIQTQGTRIVAAVNLTPATSPEGYVNGSAYTKRLNNDFITLNDNSYTGYPAMVASPLNETNEMSSGKSFTTVLQLQSVNSNLSPIIDVGTIGCIGIMNRLNNIDSSADTALVGDFVPSTESDGDNNSMVYVTRKVNLKTAASTVKVIADFFRPPTTDIKVMYKVLSSDESTPFDDLGWKYFNTTGAPDTAIANDARNFKEYEFTAEGLSEFSAFAVKIVGQGSNTSVIPLVSALRCLALA